MVGPAAGPRVVRTCLSWVACIDGCAMGSLLTSAASHAVPAGPDGVLVSKVMGSRGEDDPCVAGWTPGFLSTFGVAGRHGGIETSHLPGTGGRSPEIAGHCRLWSWTARFWVRQLPCQCGRTLMFAIHRPAGRRLRTMTLVVSGQDSQRKRPATHWIGTALRSQWPLITKVTKVRATRPTRPVTCQQPSVGNITPEALNPVGP